MQEIIPSLCAPHLQPPHLANKKLQVPTDLFWLVLFHFVFIKMLCLQFIFLGTLLFEQHLNENSISSRQAEKVARFVPRFGRILCSLVIINYVICAIYLLLFYLLRRVNTSSAVSLCFLLISAFSFSSTSTTNRATTKLIYQKQMFTTQKNCLHGGFSSIAKKKKNLY